MLSSVRGSSLGSSERRSSLMPWVLGSSVGSSVLHFCYAVCYQLHQQLARFCIDFLFKYFLSNRFFLFFPSKCKVITRNLDKFLKRGNSSIIDLWLYSEYTSPKSSVFQKMKGFSKFLEKFRSPFQRSYSSKTVLLHGCYLVKQLLLIFS